MKSSKIFLILLLPLTLCAQSRDKVEIMAVVNQVFEAMRTNDSTMLKGAFTEKPSTYTVFRNKKGVTQFRGNDFQDFVNAVGKPKEDVWNEPIWNEKVEIDGSLASVWVDYAFYLNNDFSHCGVDAFHLVKLEGGWQIFHLVDTRRRADCDIPKEVSSQFE